MVIPLLCLVLGVVYANRQIKAELTEATQGVQKQQREQDYARRTEAEEQEKRLAQLQAMVEKLQEQTTSAQVKKDEVSITLPNVLFGLNRAELTAEGQQHVRAIAEAFAKQPQGTTLRVEGHASAEPRSPESANLRISAARAEVVRAALIAAGIPPMMIQTIAFGSQRPIASNVTEVERQQNRRVTVVITPAHDTTQPVSHAPVR
jgi:outer membrane protein OmpA-like peptidoglycan-associated protein